MPAKLSIESLNKNGLSYADYMEDFKKVIETTDSAQLSGEEKELYGYKKMNLQRSSRIDKTYVPSAEINNLMVKNT